MARIARKPSNAVERRSPLVHARRVRGSTCFAWAASYLVHRRARENGDVVALSGTTIRGEKAHRSIWVCGPGAFVTMKALSFRSRGENKDAYDLVYVVRNFGDGIEDVSSHLAPLCDDDETLRAISILDEDFQSVDGLGPMRAAAFVHGTRNEAAEADAWSAVRDLLERLPV
ncbi:MAG: hypothetical protein RLZZ450_5796 [Pseudomonadota bacterium]|jgi:hypothetical protein